MNKIPHLLSCAFALALTGCGRPAATVWRDGHYKVYALDSDFNATKLGFDYSPGILGLVESEVIAAGSDLKYVVAERLDHTSNIHEYYVVTKATHNGIEGSLEGPFTSKEYEARKTALNLPNFRWTKHH
jgi:hypothetical protein